MRVERPILRRVGHASVALLALAAGPVAHAQNAQAPLAQEAQGAHSPHGGGGGGIPGQFEPPPDTTQEDEKLPVGTIAVQIRDADDKPVPNPQVTLGILHNTVAKGESRERVVRDASEGGEILFDHLETGSGIAYRISVPRDGATFAAMPFQLPQQKGMRVTLHMYGVTHDIRSAMIVMQTALFVELKDDRIQMQEAVTVFNFGKVAWVPDDEMLSLPAEYTAFNGGAMQMSDVGVDGIDRKGAKLRGTFGPGRHDVDFRWQLPYEGDKEVSFDVGLPPNTALARVFAAASQTMQLKVADFPEAKSRTNPDGEHLLITERQLRRDEKPLRTLHVTLQDLPIPGPARIIASCLAAVGVLAGLGFAFVTSRSKQDTKKSSKDERDRLLHELEGLERARSAGEIGPKTYERARHDLIAAIARTLKKVA